MFNFEVTHESQIWEKKGDPLLVDPEKVPVPAYYPNTPVVRHDLARMYSNVMEMDKQIGEKLRELEDAGLLEETIIFWYGDNGGPLPRNKREVYDSGIHVPMVVRFPNKMGAGTSEKDLVSFVDFAPTTLSLAGIPVPVYMQGQVFAGSEKAPARKYIYAARDRMDSEFDMVRAVRDQRYKYIRNFQPEKPYLQDILYRKQMDLMNELYRLEKDGTLSGVQKLWFRKTKDPEELFDTWTDPLEFNNLASDPAHKSKLEELRAELSGWMKFTEDKGFIPEKEWIASFWPNLTQPAATDPKVILSGNSVNISAPTPGSSISYKILSSGENEQSKGWDLYTYPITLKKGERLMAVADRIGYKSSKIIEYTLN